MRRIAEVSDVLGIDPAVMATETRWELNSLRDACVSWIVFRRNSARQQAESDE